VGVERLNFVVASAGFVIGTVFYLYACLCCEPERRGDIFGCLVFEVDQEVLFSGKELLGEHAASKHAEQVWQQLRVTSRIARNRC
jgi:hypothetical protein